jgi:hypothetical protein
MTLQAIKMTVEPGLGEIREVVYVYERYSGPICIHYDASHRVITIYKSTAIDMVVTGVCQYQMIDEYVEPTAIPVTEPL